MTTYVRHGVADLGIVGKDILFEHPTGYLELLNLNFGSFSILVSLSFNFLTSKGETIAINNF